MKELRILVLTGLFLFLIYTSASAIPANNVPGQIDIGKETAESYASQVPDDNVITSKATQLQERYLNNFRKCEPFHIKQQYDLFGLKIEVGFDINGWIGDKCEYKFSGTIFGIGKDIREVYDVKVTDEELSQLKPSIECRFNQEELNTLIDIVLQNTKNDKKYISNIITMKMKNPDEKYSQTKNQLTPEEEKLLSTIIGSQVCVIPNQEELMQKFTEIFEKL